MHLYQPLCQVFFHHKVILSPWTFLDINGLAEVEGNDFNDTPAYDDNAHKVVLCAHSLILCAWLLFHTYMFWLRLKNVIPMILLRVMTTLINLFCVLAFWFIVLDSFFFNAIGLTEVEKNYSDDTLACDDDTHKAVLSWLIIVCENYSIIYVLPFPIEQDYPFKFLNSCIACKDIWLLHVLPFSGQQDEFH